MWINITAFSLEIVFVVLCGMFQNHLIKEWKQNRIKINIGLASLFFVYQIETLYTLITIIWPELVITFSIELTFSILLGLIIICTQLWFILYLKKMRKWYSLPLILGLYITFGLLLNRFLTPSIISIFIIGLTTATMMIIQGVENRNSLLIGLGLFIPIYGLSPITSNAAFAVIFEIIAVSILLISSSKRISQRFSLSTEEKYKIKNVWISKMVVEKQI